MKIVIVVLVVVGVLWWALSRRPAVRHKPGGKAGKAGPQQAMVACGHCGVHLPQAEAVVGPDGNFCSEAHRLAGRR